MTAAAGARDGGSRRRLPIFVMLLLFGLLYAYDLWEALSNLVGVASQLADYNRFLIDNDLTPLQTPWAVLIANLALPPVAFCLAWWLGRGRGLAPRAALLLLGLAVVAALTLSLTALLG